MAFENDSIGRDKLDEECDEKMDKQICSSCTSAYLRRKPKRMLAHQGCCDYHGHRVRKRRNGEQQSW
jgi:hypothetical protein